MTSLNSNTNATPTNSRPTVTVVRATADQVQLSPAPAQPSPVLIDSTLFVLLLAGLTSFAKTVFPIVEGFVKTSQQAKLASEAETRQAELLAEAKTQETLHQLIGSYASANQKQTSLLTDAIVGRIIAALDNITATQASLVQQVDNLAQTQAATAHTQQRILEMISKLEYSLELLERETGASRPVSTQSDLPQSPD